ncbi:MAG: alpha/beta fold hydrolase [Phycisphaerales bacterium]|nr:alpha/beta fold hydrolase [Phycisphaerales bacterium]
MQRVHCSFGRVFVMVSILLVGGGAVAAGPEVVRFDAADGHNLVADFYQPKDAGGTEAAPLAILLHMYRSDRSAWAPLAAKLSEAGFAVVSVDMRGHGDSTTRTGKGGDERAKSKAEPSDARERVMARDPKVFEEMQMDAEAAFDWAAKQPGIDRSRVALVGASVGCSVALRTAASDPSVDAIVLMTPGLNYLGLDSVKDAERLHGRAILMLATEGERNASDTLASKLTKQARPVIVGPGVTHGTRMFGAIDGIEDRIVDFLKREVGPAAVKPVIAARNGEKFYEPDSAGAKAISEKDKRVLSSAQEAIGRGLKAGK